ncbi:DgyrCDS8886 [Dimorphilus gyrociliatus]|uniref:DgyrCDS8886 n=1 Tax=Dimorphilus gyrociliatus TaxID=2664684 RepID=A0A7I8VVF1_9ANNE|nr:DgyrCDS8886 [Dimorphilus gyrociliatus]
MKTDQSYIILLYIITGLDITLGNIKQFLRPPGNEIDTALSQSTQLALYDYFMSLTEKNETPVLEFNQNDGSKKKKEKSELEILAELRDAKRRRQSYKGKSTHTGSKNYSEIIREVIANQMELVQHEWEASLPEKEHKTSSRYSFEKKRKHSKTSDFRRDYYSKRRR